ncbi:hypothetical protein PR048_025572 [Dryococelus australis]|uniref:Uncharacterized protein n=1 Tax=Dryococelus australis TaxID=614101 RepID=A0ABQ9GRQ0_9NEOP|nr:hypothetical protein PR048_025572 [Dryococelus australis]
MRRRELRRQSVLPEHSCVVAKLIGNYSRQEEICDASKSLSCRHSQDSQKRSSGGREHIVPGRREGKSAQVMISGGDSQGGREQPTYIWKVRRCVSPDTSPLGNGWFCPLLEELQDYRDGMGKETNSGAAVAPWLENPIVGPQMVRRYSIQYWDRSSSVGKEPNSAAAVAQWLENPIVGPQMDWEHSQRKASLREAGVALREGSPGQGRCQYKKVAEMLLPPTLPHSRDTRLVSRADAACSRRQHPDFTTPGSEEPPPVSKIIISSGKVNLFRAQDRMKEWGKLEIPEKTLQPAASSSTIPTCKNLGVTRKTNTLKPRSYGTRFIQTLHSMQNASKAVNNCKLFYSTTSTGAVLFRVPYLSAEIHMHSMAPSTPHPLAAVPANVATDGSTQSLSNMPSLQNEVRTHVQVPDPDLATQAASRQNLIAGRVECYAPGGARVARQYVQVLASFHVCYVDAVVTYHSLLIFLSMQTHFSNKTGHVIQFLKRQTSISMLKLAPHDTHFCSSFHSHFLLAFLLQCRLQSIPLRRGHAPSITVFVPMGMPETVIECILNFCYTHKTGTDKMVDTRWKPGILRPSIQRIRLYRGAIYVRRPE